MPGTYPGMRHLNALNAFANPQAIGPLHMPARDAERLASANELTNIRIVRTHMMLTRGRHVVYKVSTRSKQLNPRSPTRDRCTMRSATRAYIDMVMSDSTGVHPVAATAVKPRITATLILLVKPDIMHSIRLSWRPTQTWSRAYGVRRPKKGRSRLRTTISWHEGAHHRIQTRFGRCR